MVVVVFAVAVAWDVEDVAVVAEAEEGVVTLVGAETVDGRKGGDCNMTAVGASGSWVERWIGVVGGQDALGDLSKSCARDK